MREANARGEALGPTDDELAFCDALGVNDSAVRCRCSATETLRDIARELVEAVRNNLTVDWEAAGQRPRQPSPSREACPAEVRLPARQAGVGDPQAAALSGSVGAVSAPIPEAGSRSELPPHLSETLTVNRLDAAAARAFANTAAGFPTRRPTSSTIRIVSFRTSHSQYRSTLQPAASSFWLSLKSRAWFL